MVTDWDGPRRLLVDESAGHGSSSRLTQSSSRPARAERPRPARRIPGDRPAGIYTTGQLQNLVHLHGADVGRRAVVVGAELVSWSAVLTLREAGCATALMTTTFDRSESYAAFRIPGRLGLRVPISTRTKVVAIHGRGRSSPLWSRTSTPVSAAASSATRWC